MRYGLWVVLFLQEDHSVEHVKKALPKIEGIEKKDYTLGKDDLERVKRAMGGEAPSGRIVYHRATATLVYPESGKFKTRTLVTRADGEKGPIRLVVSILPDQHSLASVKVVEHNEEKDPAPFTTQFTGLRYTMDALWRPHDDLRRFREKSKDDKALATLFGARDVMARSSEWFPKIGSAIKSKSEPKELDELTSAFEEFARLAESAFFLGDSKQKRLVENSKEAVDRIRDLAEAARAGKFEEAQEKLTEVTRKSCGSCHAGFQNSFRMEREKQGLGTGYFSVGFDLHASPDLPARVQESIALSVRCAVMLLELAP